MNTMCHEITSNAMLDPKHFTGRNLSKAACIRVYIDVLTGEGIELYVCI